MRKFIYNTQGTGISHEQIRRLENTQPGPGTYLEGDVNGHPLGDEIMLLDGLDDTHEMEALEGLGYVRAGNYRSRGYDMDGFSLSESALAAVPRNRRAGRDYQPWGLGMPPAIEHRRPSQMQNRARADLRTLRPRSGGGRSHPGGRRARRDFQPWGLGTQPVEYRDTPPPQTFFQAHDLEARLESFNGEPYEKWADTPSPATWFSGLGQAEIAPVSQYTTDKLNRPDLFIGPNFYPLADLPTPNVRRAGRDFQPWGLGGTAANYRDYAPYGLGDAASDRRAALATAAAASAACNVGCVAIRESTPEATARAQTQCRSVCATLSTSARQIIDQAIPAGTSGPVSPADQAIIDAKLQDMYRAAEQAEAGNVPDVEDDGLTTNQMLLIGGGVLAVGLLAVVALRR